MGALWTHLEMRRSTSVHIIIIIIINALSTHMIHVNLNTIFYTHVEHRPTKTVDIKYYMETHTHTHMHARTHARMHTHARTHAHTHTHTHTLSPGMRVNTRYRKSHTHTHSLSLSLTWHACKCKVHKLHQRYIL